MAQDRKVFVGGVPQDLNQDDLYSIFSEYAGVKKAWLQKCRTADDGTGNTNACPPQNHRGFGFVIFHDAHAIDELLGSAPSRFIMMRNGTKLEVKRALSSNKMSGPQAELAAQNVDVQQAQRAAARVPQAVRGAEQPPLLHVVGPPRTNIRAPVQLQPPVQWTVAAAAAAGLAGGDAILRQLALMQSAGYPVAAAQAHLPPYAQAAQPVRGQAAERELVAVGHAPLRNAIMRFYHEHRPEKLTERDFIDFICSVYEGREAELDEALRQKYGTGLRLPSGAPPQLAQAALSAAALAQAADLASRQRAAAAVASAPLGLGVAGFQAPMLEPAYAGLQEAWLAQAAASAPAAAAAAAAASAATAAASAAAVARAQAAQKSAQLAEQRAMQWMHQNAAELYPALPFLPFPVAGALHDDTVKDYSEGPDFSWIDQIVGGEEASEEVQKRREAQAASPDRRMVRVR
ncbi:unnamed protein product [Polarella glacialis]|uniref:RRM domain-containing protein n=1 Tax=Polarella glacialis TaxID=89957 RepID=A0A813G0Q1_POLGL|nr:unnamed protein product [Polarella glacialis]